MASIADADVRWLQRRPDSLLVFDDRSKDGTLKILKQWQQRHPNWIQLLPSAQQRLGPTAAFNLLLNTSTASYVALCDQDDVWHPDRLEPLASRS